jgi:hypothetical protein
VIQSADGSYGWLARVDFVEASLGLGHALETQARGAASSSARAQAWREAEPLYDEALRMALALEKEKRLVGKSRLFVADLRQGRARCDEALARLPLAELTPARPRS